MDFFVAVRILARRWRLVVVSLALGFGVAVVVMRSVDPTYEARGSVLLYAPPPADEDEDEEADQTTPEVVNPFRSFDASTAVLASVIVQIMDDDVVRERVRDGGGAPDYEIGLAGDGTPVLVVVAADLSPDIAMATVSLVQATVAEELDRRQAEAGAAEDARIRAIDLTLPDRAVELVGGRIRAFAAVAAIAIAASVSLAFLAENIADHRRQRWQEREGEPAPDRPVSPGGNGTNGAVSGGRLAAGAE